MKRYQQGNEGEQRAKKKAAQEVEQPSHTQGIAERAISGPCREEPARGRGRLVVELPRQLGQEKRRRQENEGSCSCREERPRRKQPPPYRRDQVDTALPSFVAPGAIIDQIVRALLKRHAATRCLRRAEARRVAPVSAIG